MRDHNFPQDQGNRSPGNLGKESLLLDRASSGCDLVAFVAIIL